MHARRVGQAGLSTIDLTSGEIEPAVNVQGPAWYFMEGTTPVDDSRISTYRADVQLPRDEPSGSLLLRGARVITMSDAGIIDDADVLIRDGRIAAIGARGSLSTTKETVVRDVAGKPSSLA